MSWELARDSRSAAATEELAARVGAVLTSGDVLALIGDLGSGKTTFVRGLCRGLGLVDTRQVSSPTYVLEHVYDTRPPLYHYDAYRLAHPDELLALGFEDRLRERNGVLVVEWADRVARVMPGERLAVELEFAAGEGEPPGGDSDDLSGRTLRFSGSENAWAERLDGVL